jgi:hypothetical protein
MATLEYIKQELRGIQANLDRLISTIETVSDLAVVDFADTVQDGQTEEPEFAELVRVKPTRRRWTSEETALFKRMLDEGKPYGDIATVFDVSVVQCREKAKQERKKARR